LCFNLVPSKSAWNILSELRRTDIVQA
jgi:hypothetical protein